MATPSQFPILLVAESAPGRLDAICGVESAARRRIGFIFAIGVVIAWFLAIHTYWAPSHGGTDQNGYLVGGKMFADHLSTGVQPPDLFSFVATMWNGTKWGVYYPKYPLGLPVLYAIALKIGQTMPGRQLSFMLTSDRCITLIGVGFLLLWSIGQWMRGWLKQTRYSSVATVLAHGASIAVMLAILTVVGLWLFPQPRDALSTGSVDAGVLLAFSVSPVSMALALVATFLFAREVCGSFAGLMAMLAVACSPAVIGLADNPNSHAATLGCVAWGLYLLLRWWRVGGAGRAAGAGFLIGYAATIRYTEGMLVLPILLVIALNTRWTSRRSLVETALLLAWWALPILALISFNIAAFGDFTGYDSTHESDFGHQMAFTWAHFFQNWELTLGELYDMGLFFLLPLALIGIVMMFVHAWRIALFLASWTLPSLLLYTAYYWAPEGSNVSYLRFYLTVIPPLAVAAYWLLANVLPHLMHLHSRAEARSVFVSTLGALLLAGGGVAAMVYAAADTPHASPSPMTPAAQAAVAGICIVVVLAIAWLMLSRVRVAKRWLGRGPADIAAVSMGVLTLIGGGVGLYAYSPTLEAEHQRCRAGALAADEILHVAKVPAGSVILSSDESYLNSLQFVGDWQLYNERSWDHRAIENLKKIDPDTVHPMQAQRAEDVYRMLHKLSPADLFNERSQLLDEALRKGRRVFVLMPRDQWQRTERSSFPMRLYTTKVRAIWTEPQTPIPDRTTKDPWRAQWEARRAPLQVSVVWELTEIFPVEPKPSLPKPRRVVH